MDASNQYELPEPQPVAVQLSLPWGEDQILTDSPASLTKRVIQIKTSGNKQRLQKVVIVIALNNNA